MPSWTSEQDEVLRALYGAASWQRLAETFPGKTRSAIYKRVHRLGIKREQRDYSADALAAQAKRLREQPLRLGTSKNKIREENGVLGRTCNVCREFQPAARFSAHQECAGGRRHTCTTCEGREAYASNPTARIAAARRYQKAHPEQTREIKQAANRRRHGRKIAGAGIPVAQIRALRAEHHNLCAYCRAEKATTLDHVLPLSRGGKHEIGNLLPACRKCNFTKHNRTLREWFDHLAGVC